jgi:hypothetical protein
MDAGLKKGKLKTTFHSEGWGMTRKTVELLVAIIAFATEVLAVIKNKINGRKDDHKRTPKEK